MFKAVFEFENFLHRLKPITAIISFLFPLTILITLGPLDSISASWETSLQPMFIVTNALTSYFFFELKKWRLPAFFLLLLTAFNFNDYEIVHNISAVLFFILCIRGLYFIKKFRIYVLVYMLSPIIWIISNLFWFEVYAISTLCLYHLNLIYYIRYKL